MKVNEKGQRARIIGVGVLAALFLAATIAIAPRAQTNQVSGDVHGIDVMSLGKNARNLPEEQFPAH